MPPFGTIAWLACCVYGSIPSFWLAIHPRAELWRARRRQGRPVYGVLLPLWVGIWVALFSLSFPWRNLHLYRWRYSWIAGLLLIAGGIILYAKARHGFLPLQLSGHHELEPERHEQQLVVAGIRQRVRHPIYLGHLLEMLGWSVGTGLLVCWALTAFALLTGIGMIRSEEKELVGRFGQSYREYQQRVPAIVPKL
jgi:protein-S-isoprenylcysteine O-methyltransferase Ste14